MVEHSPQILASEEKVTTYQPNLFAVPAASVAAATTSLPLLSLLLLR